MNIFETKELCHDFMVKAYIGFAGTTEELKDRHRSARNTWKSGTVKQV